MRTEWLLIMIALTISALSTAACFQPAEERALMDLEVGKASADGVQITIKDGHAAVHALDAEGALLWAGAPVLVISLESDQARAFSLTVNNCMFGSQLTTDAAEVTIEAVEGAHRTQCAFVVQLPASSAVTMTMEVDRQRHRTPFKFMVMSDIQSAVDQFGDVIARMNEVEGVEFLISTGDLSNNGGEDELIALQRLFRTLDVPIYSTLGNHELFDTEVYWHRYFGRGNFHFVYRGVHYTFIDSGDSTVDPMVYDWLEGWMSEGEGAVHVFGTHIVPVDPVGVRNGAFRSRKEAAKMLKRLADGNVDVSVYGHVHSYYAFSNAGIPAYISGGGGALPERLDGIERHFLVVDVTPGAQIDRVSLIEVD